MELKLQNEGNRSITNTLLIVPYGIETGAVSSLSAAFPRLLIVPYGIETYIACRVRFDVPDF